MSGDATPDPVEDGPDDRTQFVALTASLWLSAFVVTAVLTPPDPVTQLVSVVPFLVVSPLLAYWLVYRNGAERLQAFLAR